MSNLKPLAAHNLHKAYHAKGAQIQAVRGVSLHIDKGEILAFLGPNGAGKTTTVKMIAGLVKPDCGDVLLSGRNLQSDHQSLKTLGAVLEGNRNIYWRFTPEENLQYFGVLKGMSPRMARWRGSELLERFGLSDKKRVLTQSLSRGMQQKLALAVSLVHRPELLLLDEPTLGLDVEAVEVIKELVLEIAREGCAVLLTTHHLGVAQALAHRTAIISKGKIIIEEKTSELLKQFSGDAYTIDFAGSLNPKQLAGLDQLGAIAHETEVIYVGDPSGLYRVMALMNPVPIRKVEKDGADLTEIFLRLTKEVQHA